MSALTVYRPDSPAMASLNAGMSEKHRDGEYPPEKGKGPPGGERAAGEGAGPGGDGLNPGGELGNDW